MSALSSLLSPFRQWLFRISPDEATPIILDRRRIFILPTKSGLLFALALAVMLIGAINYNLSLGHALVFLLAGLGMVSMLHTYRNLIALRLTPGRSDPVFAGDTALFQIVLENTQDKSRRALELSFASEPPVFADIAAASQSSINLPCPALRRGRLKPGRITLSTRYPLGFFYAWSYPFPPLYGLVYPKPIDTPLPPFSSVSKQDHCHGHSGHEDFSGLRLFQANDSPRHIAWKALARDVDHRPLLIKQFSGGGASELILDWSLTATVSDSETRLSIIAGWILAAETLRIPYGLRLPAAPPELKSPSLGPAHRAACLEALALFDHD